MPAAIITGAARGIGAATARRLAGDGWDLVLVDCCADDPAVAYGLATRAELDAVAAETGGIAHVADVRDLAGLLATAQLAKDHFGGLTASIAAAGVVVGGGPLWTLEDDQWDAVVGVDLGGVRNLARATVPALIQTGAGARFVAVASAAGLQGMPRLAAYNAAKHGAVGLIRGLAADLADTGVTANAVCPGSTDTAMLAASAEFYDLGSTEEFATHHLLGRLLKPSEIAAVIAWLCSPESGALTGAVIPADGGMTAH